MRICLHTYYEIGNPYIGGTQTLLIKLAKELKILGHDAFVVCSSLNPHFVIEGVDIFGVIPKQYIPSLQMNYGGIPSSKFLKEVLFEGEEISNALTKLADYSFEQYAHFNADIYHLNSYVAACSHDITTPIVAYQHENELEFDGFWGDGAFSQLISFIKQKTSKKHPSPLLFTASRYYSILFEKIFGYPVLSIPLGVQSNDMPYEKIVSYKEDTSFGRDPSSIVILIPSRFNIKQKGQDLAILACEKLLNAGYAIELVFSGIKNSLLPELENFRLRYRSLQIANHMHFISANNMHELYKCAHIVLSPERYCSYGLSISEALSMGIPTVLSDIPTYVEIASGYQHAFFFQKDNLDNLTFQLEHVIKTAQLNNFRYNSSAIEFRINNDIRKTAVAFSSVYTKLLQ